MDFSKLSQNERLATFGGIAVVIGGLVGYSYGLTVLAVLAALAALVIVFLPQFSPTASLPGSRGSLLLVAGGIAAVVMVLALLMYISVVFTAFNFRDLFFLLAVVGSVVLAWAAWQEFQAEGGKFQLGSSTRPSASPVATSADPAPVTPAAAASPADASAAPPAPASAAPPPSDPEQRPPA
jgi:hypothetical protein